jgi:hypothetical protein
MPITYTNRKGKTYFLRQGATRSGKPRYYFSPTEAEEALEAIPAGYHIEESVNGVVSLVKDQKQLILPKEIQIVEAGLRRHPEGNNYRIAVKGKQIILYERQGPEAEVLVNILGNLPRVSRKEMVSKMEELLEKNAEYSPMLRFKLVEAASRTFCIERETYAADLPKWVEIGERGKLQSVVDQILPLLDTDEYFELM